MALIRAIPLKDFLATALSTSGNTVAANYTTQPPTSGQKIYAALHLTAVSTGRTLVMTVQSASSSGFGSLTTEISFALTSERGSTWKTATAPSTDRPWRRATWVLSTAASTAGSWNGLVYFGFR